MPENPRIEANVAVIGAGPAGIFAARELAKAGMGVALINRDIKAGGLAEYGIFHNKHKMKEGLRKQFRRVLAFEKIRYYGNLSIGIDDDLNLDELKAMGFDAILVTVGAQGTKWLGLPGEDLNGVYHAKDLVYHYNKLPPFSEQHFDIGKKVLCVGVGNVMLDIAHWCIRDLKVDQVIAVARRGPADVKFTKKEMQIVANNLDIKALDAEFERTGVIMRAAKQDPEAAKAFIISALDKAYEKVSDTKFSFDFLASPKALLGDEKGRVRAVEIFDTSLELKDGGGTKAVNTGTTREIEADTVVFCIGDKVDTRMGLPLDQWGEFAKHPHAIYPIDEKSYEVYDPGKGEGLEGIFLAGWAREASTGLVGTARKDGINGAKAMIDYLSKTGKGKLGAIKSLNNRIADFEKAIVSKGDILKLEAHEATFAEDNGLEEYKYASNKEMLAIMNLDKVAEKA